MAERDEVVEALAYAQAAGARDVALLHCVSAYPVPHGSENLGAIADLEEACNVPVGLSDHGTDPMATVAAVALGACIYEKHLVLAAGDGSVDEAVSVTPEGLAALVVTANRLEPCARQRTASGACRPRNPIASAVVAASTRPARYRPATSWPTPTSSPSDLRSGSTRDAGAA